jgi:plastocyanin
MRKTISLVIVAVLALAATAASAKTVTVTITRSGYVPSSLTISQGDAVQFVNSDTVGHQIAFKSIKGVTCVPATLVLPPSATGTCTFQTAGSYTYSDPNFKGNVFRGTITVTAAAATLSLGANPPIVIYGGTVTLSGALSTQQTNQALDVFAQQCGAAAPTKLASVSTATGGAYSTAVHPLMNTAYLVKSKSMSSPTVTVRVRPKVALVKVAAHRYRATVSAASSFAGKYGSFQRWNGTLHRWVALKVVPLAASTAGAAPTVLSVGSFRSTVRAGLRVRLTLPQAQVGGCYAPGTSNTILS